MIHTFLLDVKEIGKKGLSLGILLHSICKGGMLVDVVIREWQEKDAQGLYELCKDKNLRKNWYYPYVYPYTYERSLACIQFYQHANPIRFCIRAIHYKKQLCGWMQCEVCGYGCAELSYWLHSAYQRQGIMSEAVRQMCEISFQKLDIQTIYARVQMDNYASQSVLLKNKFTENKDTAPIYMYFLHRF